MRRCIFYYPNPLGNTGTGSGVRPIKMLEAFKECGYIVEEVSGYGKDRKEKIKKIKKNIRSGVKYDFLYSESLTMPTLLSEKKHLPIHPFLDFGFLKFCRNNKIPIGLFYRDMHWKFSQYKKNIPVYKRFVTYIFYKYDLLEYKKYVNILYCPTEKFREYGLKKFNIKVLQPGCTINKEIIEYKKRNTKKDIGINVFYVGGVSGIYNPYNFIKGVSKSENANMVICTPEKHWKENCYKYKDIVKVGNIRIVHEKESKLGQLYMNTDISVMCQPTNTYADMSVPIKTKETLGYGTPIVVSSNLAVSKEVLAGGYGWVIEPEEDKVKSFLDFLSRNPQEIKKKTIKAIEASKLNTWTVRAKQVISELMGN